MPAPDTAPSTAADPPAPSASAGTVAPSPVAERVRWAPAIVIVSVIIALLLAPIVVMVVAPVRDADSVGIYERETIRVTDDSGTTLAGFIAPEGWLRVGDRDGVERSYRNATTTASVVVTLHTDAGDVTTLLREGAPVGAGLAPVQSLDAGLGVTASFVDFDLRVGTNASQRIAVCSDLRPTHCVVFDVEVSDGGDADAALEEVHTMVRSAEVL